MVSKPPTVEEIFSPTPTAAATPAPVPTEGRRMSAAALASYNASVAFKSGRRASTVVKNDMMSAFVPDLLLDHLMGRSPPLVPESRYFQGVCLCADISGAVRTCVFVMQSMMRSLCVWSQYEFLLQRGGAAAVSSYDSSNRSLTMYAGVHRLLPEHVCVHACVHTQTRAQQASQRCQSTTPSRARRA